MLVVRCMSYRLNFSLLSVLFLYNHHFLLLILTCNAARLWVVLGVWVALMNACRSRWEGNGWRKGRYEQGLVWGRPNFDHLTTLFNCLLSPPLIRPRALHQHDKGPDVSPRKFWALNELELTQKFSLIVEGFLNDHLTIISLSGLPVLLRLSFFLFFLFFEGGHM